MINAILQGVFSIVISFINLLLSPINSLIATMLPGLNTILNYISSFFGSVTTYFGWILNGTFIDSEVLSFLILFWTFKLSFPILLYSIKLVVKWYDKLKV